MTKEQKRKIISSLLEDAKQIRNDIYQLRLNLSSLDAEIEYVSGTAHDRNASDAIDSADDSADEADHYMEYAEKCLKTALEQYEED